MNLSSTAKNNEVENASYFYLAGTTDGLLSHPHECLLFRGTERHAYWIGLHSSLVYELEINGESFQRDLKQSSTFF